MYQLSNLGRDEIPPKKLNKQEEELAEKKQQDLVTNKTIHLFKGFNILTNFYRFIKVRGILMKNF